MSLEGFQSIHLSFNYLRQVVGICHVVRTPNTGGQHRSCPGSDSGHRCEEQEAVPQADGAEMTPLLCVPASVPFLCPRPPRMALRLAQHPARCRAVGLVSGAALPQESGGGGLRVCTARGPVCAGPSAGSQHSRCWDPVTPWSAFPGGTHVVLVGSRRATLAGLSLRLDERG